MGNLPPAALGVRVAAAQKLCTLFAELFRKDPPMEPMEQAIQGMLNSIGIIGLLAITFGETFGPRQAQITEAVIRSMKVKSHMKPAANIITSIVIGLLIGGLLAIFSGWVAIPIMAMAGLLAGTKAAEVHDAKKTVTVEPESIKVKPPDEILIETDSSSTPASQLARDMP